VEPTTLSKDDPSHFKIQVTLDVTNTGKRQGAEVVQIYVGHPEANGEPPHQLRAFSKVRLEPEETKSVSVALGCNSFATFESSEHQWKIREGNYEILAGTSSRDLPLKGNVSVH